MKPILLFLGGALTCAPLTGQTVPTRITVSGTDAEFPIANTTPHATHVVLHLFRDASRGDTVALGDSLAALIAPAHFDLAPGVTQTVRVRTRAPVRAGEVLRLEIVFDALPTREMESGGAVSVRLRYLVRMEVTT